MTDPLLKSNFINESWEILCSCCLYWLHFVNSFQFNFLFCFAACSSIRHQDAASPTSPDAHPTTSYKQHAYMAAICQAILTKYTVCNRSFSSLLFSYGKITFPVRNSPWFQCAIQIIYEQKCSPILDRQLLQIVFGSLVIFVQRKPRKISSHEFAAGRWHFKRKIESKKWKCGGRLNNMYTI